MRRLFICAGLLLALPLLLPAPAAGQKKPGKKGARATEENATGQDYAQIRQAKEVAGKLTNINSSSRTLTVKLEYQTTELVQPSTKGKSNANQQNLLRQQQQLARDYQNIMHARNPIERQRRMQQWTIRFQQLQQRLGGKAGAQPKFNVVKHAKEFEFDLAPDARVTRVMLPVEYDDKGNVKEYTRAELQKLRDPKQAGYLARLEDVQIGQTLKLFLSKPKTAAPKKAEPGDAKVPGTRIPDDAGEDLGLAPGNRPCVQGILIQSEPDLAELPKEKRRKKKN
ncbi:MAG: hypothetical protein IT429_21930 [Gemmataceae bacterium]|nr:hypothetical protein [Gemmataceae bacterium]